MDFMIRLGVSVSHLTGDYSRITMEMVRGGDHWIPHAAILMVTVVGFVGGAATSGFFIHHPSIELGRPYGRSIVAIGVLLLGSYGLTEFSIHASCLSAAWACGMQNALATRFRGLVLRTTHITGLLTDLGQLLGMRLRGHRVETWKITTPLALAVAFALGGAAGAVWLLHGEQSVVLGCGSAYVVGGLSWSWIKRIPRIGRK